jgi:hypothetical protein
MFNGIWSAVQRIDGFEPPRNNSGTTRQLRQQKSGTFGLTFRVARLLSCQRPPLAFHQTRLDPYKEPLARPMVENIDDPSGRHDSAGLACQLMSVLPQKRP